MRALVILIIVAIALYYILGGGDDAPSCKQIHQSCSTNCRQTQTDTDAYNACLKKCQSALEECK